VANHHIDLLIWNIKYTSKILCAMHPQAMFKIQGAIEMDN